MSTLTETRQIMLATPQALRLLVGCAARSKDPRAQTIEIWQREMLMDSFLKDACRLTPTQVTERIAEEDARYWAAEAERDAEVRASPDYPGSTAEYQDLLAPGSELDTLFAIAQEAAR